MISIRKKIIYSILTTPFAFLTFKAYNWQTRRKIEKINDISIREQRLKEEPLKLNDNILNTLIMNDNWEFKPVLLEGYFDNNKKLLINKTVDAQPGYHIIMPFYCYKDENGNDQALIVDRGWIPYNYSLENLFINTKTDKKDIDIDIDNDNIVLETITGVIHRGDKFNKYSKRSDDILEVGKNKLFYMNPEELSFQLNLKNKISSEFIVKIIDNTGSTQFKNTREYPKILKKYELMFWVITPATHQSYAYFWITATCLNILSNVFVWIFL